jgi:hypothetical protein
MLTSKNFHSPRPFGYNPPSRLLPEPSNKTNYGAPRLMSNPSEATLPLAAGGDEVDESRRKLLLASCIAGGAATGAVAWPFLASLEPSARARALAARCWTR